MPITDRSTKEPLIKPIRIGHGTLEVDDLQKSRQFDYSLHKRIR